MVQASEEFNFRVSITESEEESWCPGRVWCDNGPQFASLARCPPPVPRPPPCHRKSADYVEWRGLGWRHGSMERTWVEAYIATVRCTVRRLQ